jgi:hypothetical protein
MNSSLLAHYIEYSIPFIVVSWAYLKWRKSYKTSTELTIKSILWGIGFAVVVNLSPIIHKANQDKKANQASTEKNMTDRDVKKINELWEPLAGTKVDEVTEVQSLFGVKFHDKFIVTYHSSLAGFIDDYDPERIDLIIENLDACANFASVMFQFDNINKVDVIYKFTMLEDLETYNKKVICKR